MKTKLSIDEANVFEQEGFTIQRETIIKKEEEITDIMGLVNNVSASDLEGTLLVDKTTLALNVKDSRGNLLFSENESEKLIPQIKVLVSQF